MKAKISEDAKVILVSEYVQFLVDHRNKYGDEYNNVFFRQMRIKEMFADLKNNQMRMILVNRGEYVPTNPRVEAKKKGVSKNDMIKSLRDLCDDKLTDSILKINMTDLEILIAKISSNPE